MKNILAITLSCITFSGIALTPAYAGNPASTTYVQEKMAELKAELLAEISASSGSASSSGSYIDPNYTSTCSDANGTCLIFTSGAEVQGDMSISTNPVGITGETGEGAEKGNSICQLEGDARFGSGKFWKAWLSSTTQVAGTDVYLSDKTYINQSGAQVSVAGKLLTVQTTDMVFLNDIGPNNILIWTGTNSAGNTIPGANCNDWKDKGFTPKGEFGQSHYVKKDWTEGGTSNCDEKYPLYCFEVENNE